MSPLAHPKGKTPSRSCNLRKGVFLRLAACQSLSLWEQRRRPPPVAETGRSCWGRGQQDASGSEADAGSRNPGSVTEGDGEGKPGRKEPLRSDGQAFCQSDTIAAPVILGQQPCPLSRACARQLPQRESLCLRGLREFVENARLKRKEFVNVIKMRRRY